MNQNHFPTAISVFYTIDLNNLESNVIQCFSQNASIEDEEQLYQGHQEIISWFKLAMQRYQFKAEPLKIVASQDHKFSILTRISGQFSNSPIQITYHFKLDRDLITDLIIS